MISIMTPTRGRVRQFAEMVQSAWATVKDPSDVEIICWLDKDDPALGQYMDFCNPNNVKYLVGPRNVIHSSRWDRCLPLATGDILFHGNDDLLFRTENWNDVIEGWFAASADKLWMVHGDDLGFGGENSAAHPVVHRRWVDTLGYFIPPYFDGDFPDTWVTDVANRAGRRKFLPYTVEHMHHLLGKAEPDDNWRERLARQQAQDPEAIYKSREGERIADAEKLRKAMTTS